MCIYYSVISVKAPSSEGEEQGTEKEEREGTSNWECPGKRF